MFISHFFMPHPPVPAWFGGSGGGLLYASHVTSPHTAAAKRPLSPGPDGVPPPHTHTHQGLRGHGDRPWEGVLRVRGALLISLGRPGDYYTPPLHTHRHTHT